jgi:Zn-dependent M28 family amino/carboxypeptidase
LHATLAGHGWDASFENFTGAEYAAVEDKDGASTYFNNEQWCSQTERDRLVDLPFANVVATRPGPGDARVVLMAHYDSKLHANQDEDRANQTEPVLGANDGASGVGVLLEVARVLGARDAPVTVTILLTDGEDGFDDCHPLAGSVWHVDAMTVEQRGEIAAVLLLDMVGNPDDAFTLAGNAPTLQDRVAAAAEEVGLDAVAQAERAGQFWVTDDHSPFMAKDIPAVDVIPTAFAGTHYWHTTQDTPDLLSAEMMGQVAQMTLLFVDRSAP